MKAIVVKQPYAALIVAGVKTIETRPSPPNGPMRPEGVRGLPGLALEPGERIAVCAAASKPVNRTGLFGDWYAYEAASGGYYMANQGVPLDAPRRRRPLPLGAVVGTVVVSDAVPMVHPDHPLRDHEKRAKLMDCPSEGDLPHQLGGWWLFGQSVNRGMPTRVADQFPLGEFAPGRWGWMLTDPQPCDPIPVVGKQGVFRLPDDVAARLAGEGEA